MKTKMLSRYILAGLLWVGVMGQARPNEKWKTIDSRSGITVYERWVPGSGDNLVRERKGEMTVRGNLGHVIATLCDPAKNRLWMENVRESYMLSKPSDRVWYSYTSFSLPWPLENRDLVSVSRLQYLGEGVARITISSCDHIQIGEKDAKRLNQYRASWDIVDHGNGLVFISFLTISYDKPEYPRLLQDPIVRSTFLRNLIKLKAVVTI